jgi:hypothetical protein
MQKLSGIGFIKITKTSFMDQVKQQNVPVFFFSLLACKYQSRYFLLAASMATVRGQWLNHFGKRLWKKIPTQGMPGPKALCQQTVIARVSLRSLRLSQI